MSESELPATARTGLPERHVTTNQVVAYNMAMFRRAAGLTQEELGERLGGWSPASVSAAERSWDSQRVKKFDADELIALAEALVVPLPALFLPPEDDGVVADYVLDLPHKAVSLRAGLPLIFGTFDDDSPAMEAYRKRLIAAGWRPRIIDDARREADETLRRARLEATKVIGRAAEQALTITGNTRERAERFLAQTYEEALADLEGQRAELEQRVYDLRTFEREYRSRLRQFLEGSYRDFMAGVTGIDADALLEKMRRQASVSGAGRVTALLLGENGGYGVYTLDQVSELAEGPQGAQSEPRHDDPVHWQYDARRPDYADIHGHDEPAAGGEHRP